MHNFIQLLSERLSDEQSSSMMAKGILGYCLYKTNKTSTKQLFEEYFEKRKREYVSEHESDVNAWERDLEKEFVMCKHPNTEYEDAKKWEDVLANFNQNEVEYAQNIMENYQRFVLRKQKAYEPISGCFQDNKKIEEAFLATYRRNGAAFRCILWLSLKYPKTTWQKCDVDCMDIQKKERMEIIEEFRKFDDNVLSNPFNPNSSLMAEIDQNLKACTTYEERIRYVTELLRPFKDFAEVFNPKAKIENYEKLIFEAKSKIEYWQTVGDNNTEEVKVPEERIKNCQEWIDLFNRKIAELKEEKERYYQFAIQGVVTKFPEGEDAEICTMLGKWWNLMNIFTKKLAALALTYGINLLDVQERCEVYLMEFHNITDYVDNYYITSNGYAQKLLYEIEAKKHETQHDEMSNNRNTGNSNAEQYIVNQVENGGQGIVINHNYYTLHESQTSSETIAKTETAKDTIDETPDGASPEPETEIPTGEENEKNHIITKYDLFRETVKEYDFSKSPKVKCLTKEQKGELVRAIVSKSDAYGAYAVAMLCHLEYDEWMRRYAKQSQKSRRGLTKDEIFRHWTEALSLKNKRAITGNYNVIKLPNSREDRDKYKSWQYISIVEKDYDEIKGK